MSNYSYIVKYHSVVGLTCQEQIELIGQIFHNGGQLSTVLRGLSTRESMKSLYLPSIHALQGFYPQELASYPQFQVSYPQIQQSFHVFPTIYPHLFQGFVRKKRSYPQFLSHFSTLSPCLCTGCPENRVRLSPRPVGYPHLDARLSTGSSKLSTDIRQLSTGQIGKTVFLYAASFLQRANSHLAMRKMAQTLVYLVGDAPAGKWYL